MTPYHNVYNNMSNISIFLCRNGPQLQALLEDDLESPEFMGRSLKGVKPRLQFRTKFIDSIIQCIINRYADLESPVVKCTRIASLRTWPMTSNEGLNLKHIV